MTKTPQIQNIHNDSQSGTPAEQGFYKEIQKKTDDLKVYNDRIETKITELENDAKITDFNKKSELSESVQIAAENKALDDIEKDFDKSLIDIYADVADRVNDEV